MNKKIFISMILMLVVCTTGCDFKFNQTFKSPANSVKVSNNNNSVPQTYDEWVAKNSKNSKNKTKKRSGVPQSYDEWVAANGAPQSKAVTKSNTASVNKAPQQTQPNANTTSTPTKPQEKQLIGEKIPNWVYENTSPSDAYYDALNYPSNFIFFTYDPSNYCSIQESNKKDISNAISKAGVSGKFVMKYLTPPKTMKCHKLNEKFAESQVESIVNTRQKDVSKYDRQWYQYSDGTYCIPYSKNGKIPENPCKCSTNYFLENCNNGGNVCIINPRKRLIVKVSPNEEQLVTKLNELKNNW